MKRSFRQQLDAYRKKSTCEKLCFVLRWRYCIYRTYQVNYQAQLKRPNRYSQRYSIASSCSCEPFRLLPFSPHAQADTQAVLVQSHRSSSALPVGCIFFSFIQILIDLCPLSRDEFNKNSSSSHPKYSLMECTHVLSLMMPEKCGIDEDLYKQPFVFQ